MTINAYPFVFPKYHDAQCFSYEDAFSKFVSSVSEDMSILDQNLKFLQPKEKRTDTEKAINDVGSVKGGYWELGDELIFDSNFESGNLDFVGKVSDNEFDLMMRLDSNSKSHQQWFYFTVEMP